MTSAVRRRMRAAGLVAATLVAAAAGCAPHVKQLHRSEGFPPPSYAERPLAVGCVAWACGDCDLDPGEAERAEAALGDLLRERLARDLGEAAVRPSDYVAGCLGDSVLGAVRRSLRSAEAPDAAALDLLRAALADPGVFLVLGQVLSDRVEASQTTMTGTVMEIRVRRLTFGFQVLDPVGGDVVWQSEISAWKSQGTEVEEEKPIDLGTVLTALILDEPIFPVPPEPGVPEFADVAWKLFGGLAKRLGTR